MLNKSISISEQVDDLSKDAQIFYTWSLAHADDFGLLPTAAKRLKGLVIPYWDMLARDVEKLIREILGSGLWVKINLWGQDWYALPKWFNHQELRRDIQPKIYANIRVKWEDYSQVENAIRTELERIVSNPSESVEERKGKEVKLKEVKLVSEQGSQGNLVNEFIKLFEAVNPSYEKFFKNKTQRAALERLLKKYGDEKVRGFIKYLPILNADKYAKGKSITPLQLEDNLAHIANHFKINNPKITSV